MQLVVSWLHRLTRAGPISWLAFVDRVVQTPKPKPFIAFAADDAYMPERLRLRRRSASGGDRALARYCELLWALICHFASAVRTWNGLSGSWAGQSYELMTNETKSSDITRIFFACKGFAKLRCSLRRADPHAKREMGHCQTFNFCYNHSPQNIPQSECC